jgi:transposase-like protein
MTEDSKKRLGQVVQIDEKRISDHLGELVRGTVEETLNGLLDAEADALCGFLKHLKERGLGGVQLVISDACLGLTESLHDDYPEAQWQRCTVHFYRNVFSHVPNAKVKGVARMLKAIHAQESLASAQIKAADIVAQLK